jgi:oligopeptide transport system ATP-binding protein
MSLEMKAALAVSVADVCVRFGSYDAAAGVSFDVPRGSCFGIVGESGSGKTTILRTILGLQHFHAGTVSLFGVAQSPSNRDFISQARLIQVIFQDPAMSLSPRRRIGLLLDEVGEILGEPREQCRLRAAEMLTRLGLPASVMDKYAHQISGGQARRAAIARALMFNPRILAADEPTAGLDVSVQGDFLNLLQEVRAATGITTLMISHNLAVVRLVADQVAVMQAGRVVELGPAGIVLQDPQADYTRMLLQSWPRPRA